MFILLRGGISNHGHRKSVLAQALHKIIFINLRSQLIWMDGCSSNIIKQKMPYIQLSLIYRVKLLTFTTHCRLQLFEVVSTPKLMRYRNLTDKKRVLKTNSFDL